MDDQAACLILTVEELEHLTMSNVYRGVCKLCGEVEVTAEYWGESAFSGFYRTKLHEEDVEWKKESKDEI